MAEACKPRARATVGAVERTGWLARGSVGFEFVRVVELEAGVLLLLREQAVAYRQRLDLGAHETTDRVLRRAHDGLAANYLAMTKLAATRIWLRVYESPA